MSTLDVSVAASADDGQSVVGGSFNSTGTSPATGQGASGTVYNTFLRFLGVAIPQGATITAAYLTVVASGGTSPTTALVNLFANDVDDAVAPTTRAQHVALVRTAASVAWSNVAAWTTGTSYQSPDITAVIQEVIDRAGWVSGNDLTILSDDASSGVNAFRSVASWNHATYAAPALHIEWTEGGTIPNASIVYVYY